MKLNICIMPEYFWHIYFASDVFKSVLGQNHIPPCLHVATITIIKSSPLCTLVWPRPAYLERKWPSDRHVRGPISKRNCFEYLFKTWCPYYSCIGTCKHDFDFPDRLNQWILHNTRQLESSVPCVLELLSSLCPSKTHVGLPTYWSPCWLFSNNLH